MGCACAPKASKRAVIGLGLIASPGIAACPSGNRKAGIKAAAAYRAAAMALSPKRRPIRAHSMERQSAQPHRRSVRWPKRPSDHPKGAPYRATNRVLQHLPRRYQQCHLCAMACYSGIWLSTSSSFRAKNTASVTGSAAKFSWFSSASESAARTYR